MDTCCTLTKFSIINNSITIIPTMIIIFRTIIISSVIAIIIFLVVGGGGNIGAEFEDHGDGDVAEVRDAGQKGAPSTISRRPDSYQAPYITMHFTI